MPNKQIKERVFEGNVNNWPDWLKLAEQGYTGVSGDFSCVYSITHQIYSAYRVEGYEFKSLQGGPRFVGGNFTCCFHSLTDLEGAPEHVGGDMLIADGTLASLVGGPKTVGGIIVVRKTSLAVYRVRQKPLVVNLSAAIIKLAA